MACHALDLSFHQLPPATPVVLKEEGAAWPQAAQLLRVQKVQQDGDGYPVTQGEVLVGHQGSSSQMAASWPSPAWLFLGENTLQRPRFRTLWMGSATSPPPLCAVREKALKLGCYPLPGLEGHLDAVARMNFQRMSPGMVQGGEALRGTARLTPLGCPTAAGPVGELLGLQGQGSPLGRCWFPVDAECHLLSHRSLPAAPGVFWQDTQAGAAAQTVLALAVPGACFQGAGSCPKGCSLQMSRDPVQGSCAGIPCMHGRSSWHLPRARPGFP